MWSNLRAYPPAERMRSSVSHRHQVQSIGRRRGPGCAAIAGRERAGDLSELAPGKVQTDIPSLLKEIEADAVLESVPVNYGTGQPALSYLQAALERGMHAITANKGPVVHGYHALSEIAQANGSRFLFEATVMDGAPIFSTWREGLPGARLMSF